MSTATTFGPTICRQERFLRPNWPEGSLAHWLASPQSRAQAGFQAPPAVLWRPAPWMDAGVPLQPSPPVSTEP